MAEELLAHRRREREARQTLEHQVASSEKTPQKDDILESPPSKPDWIRPGAATRGIRNCNSHKTSATQAIKWQDSPCRTRLPALDRKRTPPQCHDGMCGRGDDLDGIVAEMHVLNGWSLAGIVGASLEGVDETLRRVCQSPDHDEATEKVVAMEVSIIGGAEIDATASREQLVDQVGTVPPICADVARVVIDLDRVGIRNARRILGR
jgi:hypothetical protein